jgi:hypothetical protein
MPRHRSILTLLGVVLAGVAPATARGELAPVPLGAGAAAAANSGADLAARADGIADEVVARWVLLQRDDGRFPDPVVGAGEDYGTAMLGLAIARRATERGDQTLVRRGLAAVLAEVERPTNGAFEPLVLAEAYRWGASTLASRVDLRDAWADAERRLRADLTARVPAGEATAAARCLATPACWNNLKLVGALAGAVLLRTGLESRTSGALLADPALPAEIAATAGERIPLETGDAIDRHGAANLSGGGLLSDPSRDPLAYHALSTALLGRLVDELGDEAPPQALAALDRASRGLLLLAAPDGDLSWWGRGQGQVWVPAVAAEAAARAARRAPARGDLRGRYLAVAAAQLARLRGAYGVGAVGLPLVPGAVDAATLRGRSVDTYATTRGYNGLAVDALDRAAALLASVDGRVTRVPSSRPGSVRSPVQAGLATIGRAGRWVAIAGRDRAAEDARYGSGLLALQARDGSGTWSPRIPARPHAAQRVATIAVRQGGELLPAAGVILPGRASDAVTVRGGWSRPGGGATLDPGLRWRWALGRDGALSISWRARHARTVVVTALAGDGEVARSTLAGVDVLRADGTRVAYEVRVNGRRTTLGRERREVGASAYDAELRALQLSTRVRAGARIAITIRALGRPPVAGG